MISLRPATIEDREKIYQWLAHSDVTTSMMGEPHFPEQPIPSFDEFLADYEEFMFTGSQPQRGRSFIIMYDQQEVGQINYNDIYGQETEIDIWLKESAVTGLGFGSVAVNLLCQQLNKEFGVKNFYMQPSARNERAIRAYEKAGLVPTDERPIWMVPDYKDSIVMVKTIE